jgi:hypothetical protein
MFSKEFLNVLEQVLSSWQVIGTAVVVIIFWFSVNAVVSPKKPKSSNAGSRQKKLKRPSEKPGLGKDFDTSELGIED